MTTMSWAALVASTALLGLGATACGAEADTDAGTDAGKAADAATGTEQVAPEADAGDPQRYCALTRQLEDAGRRAFADLGRDATRAEYVAAERAFVRGNSATLGMLAPALPPELRDEVQVFLTGVRQRSGLVEPGTVTPREASEAERALRGYEREHC